MTSLFSYAWEKTIAPFYPPLTSERSLPSNGDDDMSIDNLAVGASSSGDTLSMPSSTDSYQNNNNERRDVLGGPSTPDALRTRKTASEIREELGLPPRRLFPQQLQREPPQQYNPNPAEVEARLGLARAVSAASSPSRPALPPMFQQIRSPQVSNASFYSMESRSLSHQNPPVQSPNLEFGQAKTAVGALVAMTNVPRHPGSSQVTALHQESSILPSRAWLRDERSIEEAQDFSIEFQPPYESLNDSRHVSSPSRAPADFLQHFSDDESSIHASPSSNYRGRASNNDFFHSRIPETSFTRAFLQENSHLSTGDDHYDFNSIMEKELVVSEKPKAAKVEKPNPNKEPFKAQTLFPPETTKLPPRDHYHQEQYTREQTERHIKEDLLISTLERLQDDNELVREVLGNTTNGQSTKLRVEGNGLITGFPEKLRTLILRKMDNMLLLMRGNVEQESFVTSLSFARSLVSASVPHEEKCSRLKHSITGMPEHGHKWRHIPGFRAALGFSEEPQSPETIRGGDTSLFSLPSDSANESTPHTSNVSMTSTITSAVTPERSIHNGEFRTSRFHNGRYDAKATLEAVCTLFCKMGETCYANRDDFASQNMKTELNAIYGQLLSIPNRDLKYLIDSFELEMVSYSIQRIVSEDQDDNGLSGQFCYKPIVSNSAVKPLGVKDVGMSLEPIVLNVPEEDEEENYNLFSPNTLDMQSLEPSEVHDPVEDLRRTVGSFDSYEPLEERDAPPPMNPLPPSRRDTKPRGLRRIFQRRPRLRRKQAAE